MRLRIDHGRGAPVGGLVLDNTFIDVRHTESKTDAHLVEEAKNGDSSAFETLIRRYSKRTFRAVHRITANREDAEDVMQETFVRAYTHLAGFEGRSRFSTWLMAIAINQALMCLRKRQKREVRIAIASDESQEISVPDIQDIRPNAEERALREEFARALGKATEGLPHPLRLVFRMRLLEEMSTEEAAVALGLSVSAVKSRLVRARRYLRQQLAEH